MTTTDGPTPCPVCGAAGGFHHESDHARVRAEALARIAVRAAYIRGWGEAAATLREQAVKDANDENASIAGMAAAWAVAATWLDEHTPREGGWEPTSATSTTP